jgi:glycosyltransferase involved in cell wall biosynthesis
MLLLHGGDRVSRGVLVFEPDAEGHSQEWLRHLIEFAAADRSRPTISVAAPRRLCQALAHALPADVMGRVELRPLSARELYWCTHRRLSVAAFARWWTMRRHLDQSGAESGFFLSLDLLALPLALGLGSRGKILSGILFRPSVHYRSLGEDKIRPAERLRDLRKDFFYRLMLRNPALGRVLSLDPFFPAYAARRYAKGQKVQHLPDPAHPVAPLASNANAALPSAILPRDRVTFLLFGYLTERKGPLVVLDALERVSPAVAARIGVLLAGRVDPALRDRLDEARRRLTVLNPKLWLDIDDRRLDDSELEGLIRRSSVVLAPYQRFVGSSGVLLWAARAGRPVLAQQYGLVGRLTRDHRLGLAVDSSSPVAVAAAITQMAQLGPSTFVDRASAHAFAASQTPQKFAAAVLAD